jgi:hypothetical protein
VSEIGVASLFYGVEVAVDDLVEVACADSSDAYQLIKVEPFPLPIHEGWQGDGSEVAYGHLILGGVLYDFCAEVAGLDGTEMLLVGLAVACVFVEHVGRACFNL